MLLSVIIPAYNESLLIRETIRKIKSALVANHWTSDQYEIIVCDNNSTDNTGAIAREEGAFVVHEKLNQIARARNAGAKIALGDWFLFIDADSYPLPELIQEIEGVIQSGKYIGCGTTIEVGDGALWNRLRMERLNLLMRWGNWCGGALILCEARAFRSIGGFSNRIYALEELDFVVRLKKYGKKHLKKFTVLHRFPLITSGRKGDRPFWDFLKVSFSITLALILLGLHYVLPKKWSFKGVQKWLGFWYNQPR